MADTRTGFAAQSWIDSQKPNPAMNPAVNPAAGTAPKPQGVMPTVGQPGAVPGQTTFSAGSNLIGTQFNPTPSDRLTNAGTTTTNAQNAYTGYTQKPFTPMTSVNTTGVKGSLATGNAQAQGQTAGPYQSVAGTDQSGARGYMNAAAGQANPSSALSGAAGMGQTGGFAYGADTGDVRARSVAELNKVLDTTPDRAALASGTFSRLLADTAGEHGKELRTVNQYNAATGRRGSGLATSDLGDVQQRRDEFTTRRAQDLASEAAGLSLSDARSKLDAASGLSNDLAGQDTAAGSLNLGYQNSNNAERGAAFDRSRALEGDAFDRNLTLSDREYGMARDVRGDAMSERDARTQAEDRQNEVLRSKADSSRRYGLDEYGVDSDEYNRGRDERDASNQYDQVGFGNRRNIFNDSAAYEGDLVNRERTDRDEMRGERQYQAGQERNAIDDRRQQMLDEEMLYGNEFDRNKDIFAAGYNTSDPYGAMRDSAGDYAAQGAAGSQGASDLYAQWARNRATGRPTARGAAPPEMAGPQIPAYTGNDFYSQPEY